MDSNNFNVFSNNIEWVQSLRCSLSTPQEPEYLINCRNFAEILHRIDETYFTEEWVEKVVDYDLETNWRLKASNLNKLLRKITSYLVEYASKTIKDNKEWKIDEEQFVGLHEHKELNKVFCLVIGCAFMGRCKEEFVQLVTQQSPVVQSHVMESIQFIMDNSHDAAPLSPQLPENLDNGANGEKDRNYSKIVRELGELKAENERLHLELDLSKQKLLENSNSNLAEQLEAENIDLRKRKGELEDRMVDIEAKVDSQSRKLESKEAELEELRNKLEQIHEFEEDYRKMKDEISELKSKEHELMRVTRELENIKQKNKDALIQKSEIKVLRETSAKYLEDSINLDDEVSKNKVLRQQVASLKAQYEDLEKENDKLKVRLDKIEADFGETKAKLATAEKKNDDLLHEKMELQGRFKELEFEQARETLSVANSLGSELETIKTGLDDRARVLQLEIEINGLKSQLEDLESLQSEKRKWEAAKNKYSGLESEHNILQEKSRKYKERINELESRLNNPQTNEDTRPLRVELQQQVVEIKTLHERVNLFEKKAIDAEDDKKRCEGQMAELRKKLDHYEVHLRKAKQLLQDQEIRINSSEDGGPTMHQIDLLRKESEQKDKLIKKMQDQIETMNTSHEEELRLTTTSYHGMAKQLEERSRTSAQPRTFLSKQWQTLKHN